EEWSPFGVVLMTAILWAGGTTFALHLRARAQEVVRPLLAGGGYPQPGLNALLARLQNTSGVLSEDASISVARGELPVVLDPWMIPKIEARHPEWVAQLA